MPSAKQFARRSVYQLLRHSGVLEAKRLVRVRSGRGWASILVFHGVSDDLPEDGVTITARRFGSILRMLKRSYSVLSLTQFVEHLERKTEFTGREVVITFDDGYLNNYESAVPLLLEHDLPACFFLTAGYVGTDKEFWWDRDKGVKSPMMSWAQARELSELGFEIGCHTWSHPDLGQEPVESADQELYRARAMIEEQVGARVEHFAYPYGGQHNIRPEWIQAIQDAGFRSNSSAYNGHATAETDRFLIPRIGAAPQRHLAELRIDIDDAW